MSLVLERQIEKNIKELTSAASTFKFKEIPSHGPQLMFQSRDFHYDSRSFESLIPALAAVRASLEILRNGRELKSVKRDIVLEVAGGYGQLGMLLRQEGVRYITTDISQANLTHGKHNGTKGGIVADARNLPFKNNSVPIVISDHFLSASYPILSLDAELQIFDEVKRVLKPEGILIVSRSTEPIGEYWNPYNNNFYDYTLPDGWVVLYDQSLPEHAFRGPYERLAILQKRK